MNPKLPYSIYTKIPKDYQWSTSAIFFLRCAFVVFIGWDINKIQSSYNRTFWDKIPERDPNFDSKINGMILVHGLLDLYLMGRGHGSFVGEQTIVGRRERIRESLLAKHEEAVSRYETFKQHLDAQNLPMMLPSGFIGSVIVDIIIGILFCFFIPNGRRLSPLEKYKQYGKLDITNGDDGGEREVGLLALEASPFNESVLCCPISHCLFRYPVKVSFSHDRHYSNQTYDHDALHQWLTKSNKDPLRNCNLEAVADLTIQPDYERYHEITDRIDNKNNDGSIETVSNGLP